MTIHIDKGSRRVFVISMLLASLIVICVLSLFAKPEMSSVYLSAIVALGTIGGFFFGNDGKIKAAQAKTGGDV